MKSAVIKRSVVIAGHKTSISLEDPFWHGLKDIASSQNMTLSSMVGDIDTQRRQGNLSSAIRLFVLDRVRSQAVDYELKQRTAYGDDNPAAVAPVASNAASNHG